MSHTGTHDTLNSLLRGELAATETYQQAMKKAGNENWAEELRHLRDDHRTAANTLRQHVHGHGGKPDQKSGPWGAWANTVEGAAKIFGNAAALKALKEGEEHGIHSYEAALNNPALPADCQALISSTLLPQTRGHIPALDRLMSTK